MGILPQKGYQDNEVVGWVTAYPDEVLSEWQDILSNLYLTLDPETCPDEWLDYVAFLFGLSFQPYWVKDWEPEIKRAILVNQQYLKKHRGTKAGISKVLELLQVTYCYWQDTVLMLPFKLPGKFGKGRMRVFILMPKLTSRTGREWREVRRVLKGYIPAVVESVVAYQGFILGRSKLGDPIFPSGSQFLNTNPDGTTYTVTI